MPLYEYECEACAHRFERIQKFSDPPIDICPVCEGTVRKLLSSPAIQFKGSGWYITDYAKKSGNVDSPGGKASGETKADGSTKADAPAEKPADKPASTSSPSTSKSD
jgi:putative FmdB family regulatory protein